MNVFSWFTGYSPVTFHASKDSVQLKRRDGKFVRWTSVCEKAFPSAYFCPPFLNRHVQIVRLLLDRPVLQVFYRRCLFEQENPLYPGEFAVDFVVGEDEISANPPFFTEDEIKNMASLDSRPMLVVMHGMNGGSQEAYLRRAIEPFVCDGAGWAACIINSRGCAGSQMSSGLLHNSRSTWDLGQVVRWLKERFPNRPLFGLGFSMGANILTHYMAEEGDDCLLTAAVLCSNPWNLEVLSRHMHGSFLMREVYSRFMTRGLLGFLRSHAPQIAAIPGMNLKAVYNSQYLHQLDRAIQTTMWNYPSENIYYKDASSVNSLRDVKIPVLALNAEDDPLSPYLGLPIEEAKKNPNIVLATTPYGGHLGWFQLDDGRWHISAIHNTLQKFWEDIDTVVKTKAPELRKWEHQPYRFCHKCGKFCEVDKP